MKKKILAWLLCAVMVLTIAPLPTALAADGDEPTTFVLSNEEGGLIDQLIAAGYGDSDLYEGLVALEPASGGIISESFLDTLAGNPGGSAIFTQTLNDCAAWDAIAINTDGTAFETSIKGRDYHGQEGYSTYPPDTSGAGRELFTSADSAAYYIDAPNGGTTYKVFAIGWSMNQPTTFVLSNEEGGLIDQLIADGHGDDSLYEVMQLLQPLSGGAIPADFMAALAATPGGSEVKTAALSNYTGLNNPVGINTDGTLTILPIYGRDYYEQTGYSSYPATLVPGDTNFIEADSPAYYIDAGSSDVGGDTTNYFAFAIAWMPVLTVAGTAADDTAILQIDNKTPSARDKTWEISVTSGTVKAGVAKADVTLSGLPAGLDYTAAKGTGNTIVITLTGAATTALTADATVTATIKGSAVTEADAQDSAGISLKLWYVGAGTTLVLTNEAGGLIDQLIAAGHGYDTLYEVLELLQPDFSSVITERFMKTLLSTPADNEVFDENAFLGNFAGLNNPVCINMNGNMSISGIFGRDYHCDTGYTTTGSNLNGVGTVWATIADSSAYYIDAGSSGVIDGTTTYYKAFAILWMPELPAVTTDAVESSGVTLSSADVSGSVTSAGTASVTERGFVYGATANPTTSDTKVTAALGTGTGAFSATLTGLSANTTYHVRAYAISAAGTAYGADRTFTTLTGSGGTDDDPPAVVTNTVTDITASGATLNGNVTSDGGATVTARGFVYGATANPAIGGAGVTQAASGSGTGAFTANISGLTAGSTYHVRAYATNSEGTSYGTDVTFTTLTGGGPGPGPEDNPPAVVTNTVTDITASGATLNGNVTSDGGATVTARGFVYGATANPAIGGAGVTQAASGSGTGAFTANISGLTAGSTYHVRAYATNSEGTSYGTDVTFTTLTGGGGEPDDPYIFRTLTDSATGITVSGVIHRDAALTVKNTVLHAAGTCAACDAIRQRMTNSDFITLIDKDISLSLGFTGSLTVTIPVGSAYNGETVTILHCASGTLKTYTATVKDGKATFTVTSLSPFAVFADADELDNIPKTGDGGGFPLWLGLMASGVLLGSVLVLRRRPKRA